MPIKKDEALASLIRFIKENRRYPTRPECRDIDYLFSFNTYWRFFGDRTTWTFLEAIYYENPKLCCNCSKSLTYDKRNHKYCNHSCSATYNNKLRDYKESPSGKKKGAPRVINPKQKAPRNAYQKEKDRLGITNTVCKIGFCKVCNTLIKGKRKTCSESCRMSIVKLNRGRHKKSYLEQSFEGWLKVHGIPFEAEFSIKNLESGRWYFVDFIFHDIRAIIELDGSQHKTTVQEDEIRDSYLRSIGYTVLRITHEQYQSKEKYSEVCSLLGVS